MGGRVDRVVGADDMVEVVPGIGVSRFAYGEMGYPGMVV